MYLVVWTMIIDEETTKDHFRAFEHLKDAKDLYRKLLGFDNLHNASIAAVIESTDYEVVKSL